MQVESAGVERLRHVIQGERSVRERKSEFIVTLAESVTLADRPEFVRRQAAWLEVLAFGGCLQEVLRTMGLSSLSDTEGREEEIDRQLRTLGGGVRIEQVLESVDLLRSQRLIGLPPAATNLVVDFDAVLAATRVLAEAFPIEEVLKAAADENMLEWGHRAQIALWSLKAFLRRNDPEKREMLKAVGCAYAEGRLSVGEVATILRTEPAEAILWLEQHGFCRSLESIEMTETERARKLAAIRAERLQRRGEPRVDAELVRRDVLSSQRIEGIDARTWLKPGS